MIQKKHTNNVWKTGIVMATTQNYLLFGVYVIYMLFIGLSITEVSIVISFWLILSSIGQIPAGIFADRYGYKL